MARKEKKITVKFFVNKTVKPEVEGREKRYPLYMIITYNRRNTTMKSRYGGYYKNLEEAERDQPGMMALEEKNVQKIIRYEISKQGKDFDLKGINNQYEIYSESIENILAKHLKNILWMAVLRSEPQEYSFALNFASPRVHFETLYTISRKIFKDLNSLLPKEFEVEIEIYTCFKKFYPSFFSYTFPTVIEWLDKSIHDDYRQKLERIYKKDKKMVDKSIAEVNRIIHSQIVV